MSRFLKRDLVCPALFLTLAASTYAQTTLPSVSVTVEILADAPQSSLVFRVRNVGTSEVVRGELGIKTNKIVVLGPDGAVSAAYGILDPVLPPSRPFQPAVLSAGEEMVWERSVENVIGSTNTLSGVFRVYWDFSGVLSDEIRVLRRPGIGWDGKPLRVANEVQKVSANSPIEATKRFYQAMDGDPVRLTFGLGLDESNKAHLDVAFQLNQRAMAASRFKKSVTRRFGEAALDAGWFFEASRPDTMRELDEGTVTYSKHFLDAYLEPKGWGESLHLVRRGTSWQVSADNYMLNGNVHPDMAKATRSIERTADEIDAGKYKTLGEAREAMRLRLWENREPDSTRSVIRLRQGLKEANNQ